eukprot:5699938-Alexandrium_andersonii.AAC.1
MSASLVGSEMCIRDRQISKDTSKATRKPSDTQAHKHARTKARKHASTNCLLYTSDAADDM